jgi:hypothetical protein
MNTDDLITRGRAAFARRAWTEAYDLLLAADRESALAFEDLERLGLAANLIGMDDAAVELGGRAYHIAFEAGDIPRAARHAFWARDAVHAAG